MSIGIIASMVFKKLFGFSKIFLIKKKKFLSLLKYFVVQKQKTKQTKKDNILLYKNKKAKKKKQKQKQNC